MTRRRTLRDGMAFYRAAYYREQNTRILLQILVTVLLVVIAILLVIVASAPG